MDMEPLPCPCCGSTPKIVEVRRMFYPLGVRGCPFCGLIHHNLRGSLIGAVLLWNDYVRCYSPGSFSYD